jgi:hypothetical protein
MPLCHYLLVYNVRDSRLVTLEDFQTDSRRATEAYAEKEREYLKRDDHEDFEIVLVGADSLDTIKVTHSRYFEDDLELVPFS